MDKASVFGTEDCRFESYRGQLFRGALPEHAGKNMQNAHRGARTHDHKVKSLALYQLS
jgi:hypothetical protein